MVEVRKTKGDTLEFHKVNTESRRRIDIIYYEIDILLFDLSY